MSIDTLAESKLLLTTLAFDESTSLTHEPFNPKIDYADDLQTIDKWDEINNGHHNEKRKVERYKYRSCVRLAFACQSIVDKKRPRHLIIISGYSKDISTQGAGVLCPERIVSLKSDEKVETLLLKPFLSISDPVALGLQRAEGNWITMKGEIRNLRKTRNDLIYIGIRFCKLAI